MKTISVNDIYHENGSLDIHVWQDGGEYYSCRSGEYRGNYSETDDLGPFDTEQEAVTAQREEIQMIKRQAEYYTD